MATSIVKKTAWQNRSRLLLFCFEGAHGGGCGFGVGGVCIGGGVVGVVGVGGGA